MPKRTLALALALLLTLPLSGCDSLLGGDESYQTVNRTYKLAEAASSQGGATLVEDTPSVTARTAPVLYHPDSTGKYIVCRELTSLSLQDQALDVKLVEALTQAKVLDGSVTLRSLSFDWSEDNSLELVLLDFNKRFQNQVKACQTPEEERLLVGSVVNTFLSAYDRQGVLLTVNGERLYSNFEDYSYRDPVLWYPTVLSEPYTTRAKLDNVSLKVELTPMYSEAGFLLDQDTETFHYRYDYATHTASYHAQDTRRRAQTPAYLSITTSGMSLEGVLTQLRQELGSGVKESTQSIGKDQIQATYLTKTENQEGTGVYCFQADGKTWIARTHWNTGEEETRLPRMKLMLSTFQAVS